MTLDDDLAERLSDAARESHMPFKAVVNEALRRGLGETAPQEAPFRLQPHAGRLQPGIDDRRFNELAWETDQIPARRTPSDRDL
ncbi:MAG: hypothetical protein M3Y57_15900 [Acidobacteriota bacterium]|nr:hypothetical protein [Acidobacteriota bacterium]